MSLPSFFAKLLTGLGFLALAGTAHAAAWEGVFEGTLGKSRIIVELFGGPDNTDYPGGFTETSRYSYVPKAYDLQLVLQNEDGGELEFDETDLPQFRAKDVSEDPKRLTGRWKLQVNAAGAKGSWSSPNGKKTLPIILKRVPLAGKDDIAPDSSQLSTTYNDLWGKGLAFSDTGKTAEFNGTTLTIQKDSAFGVEMPVVTKLAGGDEQRLATVQAMLDRYYRRQLQAYRDCINGVDPENRPTDMEANFTLEAKYASDTLFSLMDQGSIDCGGAHPSNYATPVTFDLVKAEQMGGIAGDDVAPQNFGRIFKLANPEERKAFDDFAMGRWMKAAEDAGKKGGDDDIKECRDPSFMPTDGEPVLYSLSFTQDGLAVQRTDYPHVISVCIFQDYNPTIIPWADLKPWLRPDQALLALPAP